ncbi:hypothetical protein PLICRDRAFT_47286 [Plicaturopsis crispa FD-325 SS-3]|uniref:Unplaced genomic scaffold PLICRscaffold_25, whole genome shotgun sequence n=1 Tax=Plicaturopsis crispa FD-325 SS-3 TaxID=944288 RepID=A0A0C9SQ68_PLICR|nr:hypothetical protein PLICRDRAFT_47286 [Plicaturopsis crispa FD-325 SS-3]
MDPVTAAIDVSVFSQLPSELIVKILDIAAASSKHTALALCLVCSWTHKLAHRRLLDTIAVSTLPQTEAFLRAFQNPCSDLSAVRHMWLAHEVREDCMPGRLPNLAHLAITPYSLYYSLWENDSPTPPHPRPIPSIAAPNGTLRLTLIPSSFTAYALVRILEVVSVSSAPALLNSVTHLSYALFREEAYIAMMLRSQVLQVLPVFPRLTHLAVAWPHNSRLKRERLDAFCAGTAALRVVVLVMAPRARAEYVKEDPAFPESLHERYPHAYVVDDLPGEPVDVWLEEVRGGDSIWNRAVR